MVCHLFVARPLPEPLLTKCQWVASWSKSNYAFGNVVLSNISHFVHAFICYTMCDSWWHHQMKTFPALLAFCVGNSPVPGEFPAQRPVTLSFDVFFHLRLNKWLSKQSWGWWLETLSRPLWRHRNGYNAVKTCKIWRIADIGNRLVSYTVEPLWIYDIYIWNFF